MGLVDAAIIGNRFVGSLVGYAFHTEVRRTYATGDVEGISNVGGLFGIVGGSVYDSYAMGTVMGAERVGGLAGASDADILRSFSSATVLGGGAPTDEIVGGLVGYQIGGTIRQSYAVGPVGDAGQILGGLVGYQAGGSITQSYATGPVRGDNIAGGLVGYQSYGSISDSYWNTETTGQDSAAGFQSDLVTVTHVQGLSTAEMLEAANFSGFDFRTVWANAGNQTTPFLRGLAGNQVFNANDLPEDVIGESNLPALYTVIQDAEQLQAVQKDLAGRYVLGNDIDARVTAHWNCDDDVSAGFAPLGDGYGYFTGVFDGLGHVIQGLTIHRPNGLYVGLFGNTFNAAISNLGIVDADITGDRHVGGLAGFLGNGIIHASYVTGSVTGDVEVGGLVGTLGGSIRGSHAAAMVAGDDRVGGLVGASYASISGSYATGSVTGGSQVGGLVGYQGSASISTSYATGAVRGDGDVGGLVGVSSHSTIEHSYWNTETTGQGSEAGSHFGSVTVTHVQGLSTAEMLEAANYSGFDFSTVWANAGNRTTPYFRGVGGNQVFIGDDLPAGAIDVTKRPALYTVIQNAMQLQAMQRDPAGRYVLGNDIDARATAEWNCDAEATCAGFAPIGTSSPIQSNPFSGVFDGLGYVIQGLTIHRPDADYVGLFGLTQDATLRRVGLVGGSVTGGWYVGSLVGSQGGGSIEQSYATGSVSGVSNVGGLVGWSTRQHPALLCHGVGERRHGRRRLGRLVPWHGR